MGNGSSRCVRFRHFQWDPWNQCRDCAREDRRRQQREREARELQEQRAREKQCQEQRQREAQAQYEREMQRLRREQREREERLEREMQQARERQERLKREMQLARECQERLEREMQEYRERQRQRQLEREREQQRLERERQERLARERQLAFEREQQRLERERQRIQMEYARKQASLEKEHAEEMEHIKLQAEKRLNEIAKKEQKVQQALKDHDTMSKHFLANARKMLDQMKNELLVQIKTIEERNEIAQTLIDEKAEYEALEKRMMEEIVDDEWAGTKAEFGQKFAQWKESCKKLLESMLKEHREGKIDQQQEKQRILLEAAKRDQLELMKVSKKIGEYFFQKDKMEGDFGEYSRQYIEQVFQSC